MRRIASITVLLISSLSVALLPAEEHAVSLVDIAERFGSASRFYEDGLVVEWSRLYRDGRGTELLRSVERNLLGTNPHPLAPYVWSVTARSVGQLETGHPSEIPSSLRNVLGVAPRILVLYSDDRHAEVVAAAADRHDELDMWSLFMVAWSADSLGMTSLSAQVHRRLLERYPGDFGVAWMISGELHENWIAEGTRTWLAQRPDLADSPAGGYLEWALAHPVMTNQDRRAAVSLWLDQAPGDARALRFLGHQLFSTDRYDEAIEAYRAADVAFPFFGNWERLGAALIQLRRPEEARAFAAITAERDAPSIDAPRLTAFRYAEMAREAGHLGIARSTLLEALETWPGDRTLTLALARVSLAEGFPGEAGDYASEVLAADPRNAAAADVLAESLRERERFRDSLAVLERYQAAGGFMGAQLLYELWMSARAVGDHDRVFAAAAAVPAHGIDDSWVQQFLAFSLHEAGRHDEAYDAYVAAVRLNPASGWYVSRLAEVATAAGRAAELPGIVAELIRDHPHEEAVWKLAVSVAGTGEASIWNDAIDAVPRLAFPYINQARLTGTWSEARRILTAGLDALALYSVANGQRALLAMERSWVSFDAYRAHVSRDVDRIEEALDDLELARENYVDLADYWNRRHLALAQRGAIAAAAEALLEWERVHPDGAAWRNFFLDQMLAAFPDGAAHAALTRHIERRPRDEDRLEHGAHFHLRWGGSPVVAVRYAERLLEFHPGARGDSHIREAYGRLGAHREHYRQRYGRASAISASGRYVGWFEQARAAAWSDEGVTIRNLDPERASVTLLRADGIEESRQYDPVTGQLLRVRVGAAEMSLRYSPAFQLEGISVSGRPALELGWSAPAPFEREGQIRRIRIAGRPEMTLSYDEFGRISEAGIESMGRMEMRYEPGSQSVDRIDHFPDHQKISPLSLGLTMQQLISEANRYMRLAARAESLGFDDLPFEDETADALRDRARASRGQKQRLTAAIGLARHLRENLDAHGSYADELETITNELFRDANQGDAPLALGVEAVRLWRELQLEVRPEGLPADRWATWNVMLEWMQRLPAGEPDASEAAARLVEENRGRALRPLSTGNWLARSYLDNPGFWNHYDIGDVVPRLLAEDARLSAILTRRNGDVVVGSNVGLSVLRAGYWEWYAFDRRTERFTRTADYGAVDAHSRVTALAEDGEGRLWIGTAAGLVLIPGDYEDEGAVWRGSREGLPGGRVEALAGLPSGVVVGGAGARRWDGDGPGAYLPGAAASNPVDYIRAYSGRRTTDELILVGGRNGLLAVTDGGTSELVSGRTIDSYFDEARGELFVLRGQMLVSAPFENGAPAGPLLPVPQQETIVHSGGLFGLVPIEIENGESVLAVLTDQGMSLYRDFAFEHQKIPDTDQTEAIVALDQHHGRVFMLTTSGVSSIERGQVGHFNVGRVHDLLTHGERAITYVANGRSLLGVHHGRAAHGPRQLGSIAATRLALDGNGRLVANDGYFIVRFEGPSGLQPERLFAARPTVPSGQSPGPVTSLLVAKDGTIWVTAGSSLFEWREGFGSPIEHSIFIDYDRFPVNSDMLEKVIETSDGRIWVVASNEAHRTWNGLRLDGGLFERTDTGWERVGSSFITAYTVVDAGRAIVGTGEGFQQHRGGRDLTAYRSLGDPTYDALRERSPALFLGTRGAQLDDQLWLFGSASGLVAFNDGAWLYPDRLNWMLPRQDLALYGSRVVHAVATDSSDRVYAGTDAGLMIYDPLGAGAETFLVSNDRPELALQLLEQRSMREIGDVLLNEIDPDSEAGRLVERYRRAQERVEAIRAEIDRARAGAHTAPAGSADGGSPPALSTRLEGLETERRRAEQERVGLLARLERDDPTLFQMLQINPIDLSALRRDLDPGTAIVQYIPSDERLYIAVVTSDAFELRTVTADRTELMGRAERVARSMALAVRFLRFRGETRTRGSEPADTAPALYDLPLITEEEIVAELAWLYDMLVRPVEHDIREADSVLVVPTGSISYVPFPALVRDRGDAVPDFAVNHFSFGVLPTFYSIAAGKNRLPSVAFDSLVLGDSDGTLPGARTEAADVAELLGADRAFIGPDATFEELLAAAPTARTLHLAVHGKLNAASPADSYLLLANDDRLTLTEAMSLPLEETELVFLSACESGLGASGLEYRTIAQAFAHAGAPTVVATLWEVNDAVAVDLVRAFYEARTDGLSTLAALAHAQRTLVGRGGDYARPEAWAPFTVFGGI